MIELTAENSGNPRPIATYIVIPNPPEIPVEDSMVAMASSTLDACDVFMKGISLNKHEACSFSSQEEMVASQKAWLGLIQRYSSDFVHSLLYRLMTAQQ